MIGAKIAAGAAALAGLAALVLLTVCVWAFGQIDAQKARADTLAGELALRQQIDVAAAGARVIVNAPRADIEREFREFLQEAANDPLSEECSRHPAFARAYGAIDRLQRIQDDALRGNPGRSNRTPAAPDSDGKTGH